MGVNGEASSRAGTFEVVLWGYDRSQVEACITQLEGQLTGLYDEQRRVQDLTAELERLRVENGDLRARTSGIPAVRPVGSKVEQILALAEEQALEVRTAADRHLTAARQDAAAVVAAAKQDATRIRRDCELATRQYRQGQHQAADGVLAAARADADRMRGEAESYADRLRTEAQADADRLRAEAQADADRIRAEARAATKAGRRRRTGHADHPHPASPTDHGRDRVRADRLHGTARDHRPPSEPNGAEPRRSRSAGHDRSRPVPAAVPDESG